MDKTEAMFFDGEELFPQDILTLNGENGEDIEATVLDILTYQGKDYIIMIEDDSDDMVTIVEVIFRKGSREVTEFAEPENDEICGEVFELFKQRNPDYFED